MANKPKVAHDNKPKVKEGRPTGAVNKQGQVKILSIKPGFVASQNKQVPK